MQKSIALKSKLIEWRDSRTVLEKFLLSFAFALITGIAAQIRIYLPWTPVPITGQTFAVILSGIVMGVWGGFSQILYVMLGVMGMPWFSGGSFGYLILFGPTGGYLLGFIFAATLTGYLTEKNRKNLLAIAISIFFANFIVIYAFGLAQLACWSFLIKGIPVSFSNLLLMGFTPFIVGDAIKVLLAVVIAKFIHKI